MIIKNTYSAEETAEFAKSIGETLRGGDIIAFKGGMGAGKTAFTRGLSVGLGFGDVVSSPTFTIVNEYGGEFGIRNLYHFDMYRVMNYEAFETTGFYDYMSDDCVIAVEWSENIADVIAEIPGVITVAIEQTESDNERKITVSGGRFEENNN